MLSIKPKFKRVKLMSNVFIINKRWRKESFRGDCCLHIVYGESLMGVYLF